MAVVTSRGYAITERGLGELDRRGIPHRGEEVVAEGGQRLDFGTWNPDDYAGTVAPEPDDLPVKPKRRNSSGGFRRFFPHSPGVPADHHAADLNSATGSTEGYAAEWQDPCRNPPRADAAAGRGVTMAHLDMRMIYQLELTSDEFRIVGLALAGKLKPREEDEGGILTQRPLAGAEAQAGTTDLRAVQGDRREVTGGPAVKAGHCLLKVLAFLVLMPFVFALPPAGFALFAFVAFTLYFCRKG